jgi:E3 ubiquitin-protein ligase MARCH6
VKKGTPFSNGQIGREWEATIIDLLHQAGGVMKVILIISIEMLVFPLYCGLLLDAALLPLFDGATIMSRLLFMINSPCTSIFVHWFVGTCYMFHFALFVSMCRKIMRKGVLCKFAQLPLERPLTLSDFIRDPDDPTFHPVRDVLERNVATQLRKILFSALVYGALVVICLGGVVWGLSFAFRGVLPIHWSSNEPVLEFPIDLLFYNFLMPLAVRFFKPSDGLHAMYRWWFRRCARMLRLTWFMFDERKLDEEGYNVRRSWGDLFRGVKGDPLNMVKTDDPNLPFIENPELTAYFRQNGRYVRAPASDQVRIPKGTRVFLQVDELNNRIDGTRDSPDGVHGRESELYKQVYIPPYFRLRIFAFILSIWIFAALTGVCITIVPLVIGRKVFSKIIPSHVRKNDVYAFSIGIYVLGSALYAILHLKPFFNYLATSFSLTAETPRNILKRVATFASLVARIVWTYSAFIFLLPTLFAFLIEFYAILPLHTYFAPNEPHTIHFVQSWTLGLLYVKLTTRLILFYSESRPAASLRAITRNGYLNPDARLATRSFILPASFALGSAITWPWLIAKLALMTIWKEATEEKAILVYRYVYPAVLAAALCGVLAFWLVRCVRGWKMRIRDEVYLIGERLHNFGERKSGGAGVGVVSPRRIET